MLSAERLALRSALWPQISSACEEAVVPPLIPVAAGGLSGRPRCRIFPVGRLWVLQMETAAGWRVGHGTDEPPMRLTFLTLAAAIAHAEMHGFDYRIIKPAPVACFPERYRVGFASGCAAKDKNHEED